MRSASSASHGINDALIALPVALAVSALFALATGIVCLRTKGVYFIMITLAFGQMVFFTASSLAPYGGDDGLTIRMRATPSRASRSSRTTACFYYVCLACLLGDLSALPRADRLALRPRVIAARARIAPRMGTHRLRGLSAFSSSPM